MDNYIVDFFCKGLLLVIEKDGSSHNHEDAHKADLARQQELEAYGIHFLRFMDSEVKQNLKNVLRTIEIWIENRENK